MPHIEIAAEKIWLLGGFPITNTLIMSVAVTLFLVFVSRVLFKNLTLVPAPIQNIFEYIIEKFLDAMQGMFGSREKAEKYFPFIATIFLFILLSNWFGILPGIGSVGFFEKDHGEVLFVPLFRSAASDLNFTLTLGIIAVLFVNVMGASAIGIRKHIGKFFNFRSPIGFFLGILEFISELAKVISFSFRLFGNVFAGEVLLVITAFLVPYFIPVPFLALELFVGFIQALVFSMLTMVFISIAVQH